MSDNYQHELAQALISEQRQRDALRAENARLQDALDRERNLHGDTCGELETAIRHAQEAERERDHARHIARLLRRRNKTLTVERDEARAEVRRLQDALANSAAAETDAVKALEECRGERDEARRMYRAVDREIFDMFQELTPDNWAYVDSIQALFAIERHLTSQRDEARGAINELLDYLKRVADYQLVDAEELGEFIEKTRAMYGIQADADAPR